MLDDNFSFDDQFEEGPQPEESNNRTFVMVAGGLGVLILCSLIFMAVYALIVLPNQQADGGQVAAVETQNASIAQSLTETAIAESWTATPSNTPAPTSTATQPPSTATEAAAEGATQEPEGVGGGAGPTADPRTATVQALLTQASVAQTQAASSILTVTPTATSVTNLPDTGLIDDLGLPGLVGMAALLLVIIFAARRLRENTSG